MGPRERKGSKVREDATVRIPVRRGGAPQPPRRGWWSSFAKYWAGPFAVAVVAGVILLAVEYDLFDPDDPADPEMTAELHEGHWQTNGSSADVAGAYAEGDVWRQSDGGVFVAGMLKDTVADGESAVLEVEAVYADGRPEFTETRNSLEKDHVVPVGVPAGTNAHGHLFPDGVEKVLVRECRSAAGAGPRHDTECGSAPAVIWSKHP